MSNPVIYRKPHGKTFSYCYANGKTVKNAALKRWIKSLAIPPAWREVEIQQDRDAKVLVTGRDKEGRKQYIYNPDWVETASEQKFKRILRFAEQLETMRRVTGQHIQRRPIDQTSVLACMTRMLDDAFFRPGSASYTRQNQTYGLTTLRAKHMTIKDDRVEFDYEGKSHQQQFRTVTDEQVREVLIALENTPAVCRSNYIHPQVILQYESGRTLDYFRRQFKRYRGKYLSLDEKATMQLLTVLIKH